MRDDRRHDLIEDIIEGIAHGDVADSSPAFSITRVDGGSITVDLGEPRRTYVVTVTAIEHSEVRAPRPRLRLVGRRFRRRGRSVTS